MHHLEIILASASPRRKLLLELVGFRVQVIPSQSSEEEPNGCDFCDYVRRIAKKKSLQVAKSFPDHLVLGADTLVICADQPMGKPRDAVDAATMLTRLSGTWHRVITGIYLTKISQELEIIDHATTEVRFFPLTSQEIDDYVRSGESHDKAGAYGIQGLGARFVQEIRGCFYNVVGLPLGILWQHVKTLSGG